MQDDLGYVKLVTRFIGAPLVLRTDSGQRAARRAAQLRAQRASPTAGRSPTAARATRRTRSTRAAYPSGRLRISLLLASARLARGEDVRTDQGRARSASIAQRISRRFTLSPSSFAPYIQLVHTLTHALVYVRSGSRKLAGGGPSKLPSSGPLSYHRANYEVSSFSAPTSAGQVRVYVLVAL